MKTMKALLIDLDCTLYPMESALYLTMGIRITDYMQAVLGMTRTEAIIKRDAYWKEYGLTLIGLIRHHDISAEDFLHYVHNVNIKKIFTPIQNWLRSSCRFQLKKYCSQTVVGIMLVRCYLFWVCKNVLEIIFLIFGIWTFFQNRTLKPTKLSCINFNCQGTNVL
ncbi:MAG: hypothetical protein OMM_12736 [Candidatus Magnetoglobus multicellularis str. Araruama]|uniref:Pyrimidine 5'-nucleotidase n=1 Tax=Candidatus Magnetoglobus multicellularis str. Araruama TaxID=890399 RepID=A0A1V1NV72_9BACT|nr:MAG: hypothetical protein OMM_12736 [Candidatus Magnetoglobus multicellularis str. Araruama]